MKGKRGLIMGVANERSIAWGIAQKLSEAGAELAFTYLRDALKKRVIPLAEKLNSNTTLSCDVEKKEDVVKLFEDIIISGEVKMIKPDSKIYQLAIDKFNLNPNKTVFIDDKLININAAAKIGFKTIHLTNPNVIKNEIESFL